MFIGMSQTNERMEKFAQKFQPFFVLVVAFAVGCGDSSSSSDVVDRPEGRFTLIDNEVWETTDSDTDPYTDRPTQSDCPAGSHGIEELNGEVTYAVTTDFCDYLTLTQETSAEVLARDTLHYRVFHFGLTGPDSARAHVALRLGDQPLLDEWMDIPADSALHAGDVEAGRDFPAGTPVYFHVHNHGSNEYSIIELSAEAP
jgi:hypothetical protein